MLSKNIKELRIEKGYTQMQLAEKIGVTQGAIYFWEKGINEPTAGYLIKLAQIFEISVDELLAFKPIVENKITQHSSKINMYFNKLTHEQQDILISVAKEFIKSNN